MTDKELRKLNRVELLEILYKQRTRIDEMTEEIAVLRRELADKRITIGQSGSIAEASLALTRVFEEAQKAADQYLENVRMSVGVDPEGECPPVEEEDVASSNPGTASERVFVKESPEPEETKEECDVQAAESDIQNEDSDETEDSDDQFNDSDYTPAASNPVGDTDEAPDEPEECSEDAPVTPAEVIEDVAEAPAECSEDAAEAPEECSEDAPVAPAEVIEDVAEAPADVVEDAAEVPETLDLLSKARKGLMIILKSARRSRKHD